MSSIEYEEGRKEGIIDRIKKEKEYKLKSENQRLANGKAHDMYTKELQNLVHSLDELKLKNGQFRELILSKLDHESEILSKTFDSSVETINKRLETALNSTL